MQTQVSRKCALRIKTHTIITYLQQKPLGLPLHTHVHPTGTSMLDCVMQSLLRKPVEFLFDLERQVGFIAQFRQYFNAMSCTYCCCLPTECRHQSLRFQRLWTQPK